MPISITDPIGQAINRSKFITFQPFNIGKWFVFGFIVFLATLDEGGNTNYRQNFPMPGGRGGGTVVFPTPTPRSRRTPPTRPAWNRSTTSTSGPVTWSYSTSTSDEDDFKAFWRWVSANVGLVILIAIGGAILIFAISLVIIWINSRAKFILLEAIANDTYKVVEPWKRFRSLGNSLFGFRAVISAIGFGCFLLIAIIGFFIALPDIRAGTFAGAAIGGIIVAGVAILPFAVIIGLIDWATKTFISHIMFATGQTTLPAWREFRQSVLPGNGGRFVLFALMQILLAIAVGIAQMLIGCATCCIGFLPYLSSVVALPLHVFWRAYPIYFFQQFSPRYQIITEPVAAGGFPVLPVAGYGGYAPPTMTPPDSMPPPTMPPPSRPPPPVPPR
jgi:hypothetical protein